MNERIRIKTADQLFGLPGYTDNVDPSNETHLRVVGSYWLSPMIPCGLKCRQPHNDGVVVELSGGRCTNVGHVCGQQFGERFNVANKDFAERVARPGIVKAVGELKSRLAMMNSELHGLRIGTNSLCEKIQAFRVRFLRLSEELTRRANGGNDRVFEHIARSNSEIEDLVAATVGSRREQFAFREEFRGSIPGLRIFALRLREEIITEFVEKAESLVDANLIDAPIARLYALETWAENFDPELERVHSILAGGESFFTPGSFALLAYIATSKEEATSLKALTVKELLRSSEPTPKIKRVIAPTKRETAAKKKLDALVSLGKGR